MYSHHPKLTPHSCRLGGLASAGGRETKSRITMDAHGELINCSAANGSETPEIGIKGAASRSTLPLAEFPVILLLRALNKLAKIGNFKPNSI
jgi:hypothetical protein